MNIQQIVKLSLTNLVIAAAGAQASEITEFPLNPASELSRAEVQADARNASQPKGELGFSYDTATLARELRSGPSRTPAQMDKPSSTSSEKMAGTYFIGGM